MSAVRLWLLLGIGGQPTVDALHQYNEEWVLAGVNEPETLESSMEGRKL